MLANSFSHPNDFPNLHLILANITNTANSSDEAKRTALMCKSDHTRERLTSQDQQLLCVVACTARHPFIWIINNDYLKKDPKILHKAWPWACSHSVQTWESCFCMQSPLAIPKSFCIHLGVCLHKGTNCIIKMMIHFQDGEEPLIRVWYAPLLWGKGFILVRMWG